MTSRRESHAESVILDSPGISLYFISELAASYLCSICCPIPGIDQMENETNIIAIDTFQDINVKIPHGD